MSDDQIVEEEERLRALMRRSDGPMVIRPLHSSPPDSGSRYGRLVSAMAFTVVMVASAAIGAGVLNSIRQPPASPAPTSSALASPGPSGSVGPTPSAALAPDATHLLVVNLGGNGIGVRTEANATPFFRVENRTQYAVSNDGKLAYWRTGPDDELPHELHIYDTTARTDRMVLRLTDEKAGAAGFMVWSTDGTGLALSIADGNAHFEGRFSPSRPTVSSWRLLDVATGQVRQIATISGAWFVPVSWDRVRDVATATEFGRDRTEDPTRLFYVFDQSVAIGKARQIELPAALDPWSIRADSSAKSALGLEATNCSQGRCNALWTWPITDPGAGVRRQIPSRQIFVAAFRPGTSNVFVQLGPLPTSSPEPQRLEDWGDLGTQPARIVSALTNIGPYFFFRGDGTAIVLGTVSLVAHRGALVDPENGGSVTLPLDDDVLAGIAPRLLTSATPSPGPSGSGFATAQAAADAAKQALEQRDFQVLFGLVAPTGWYARWYEQGQTDPMSRVDAAGWLSNSPNATWRIDASEVRDSGSSRPLGDKYVTAFVIDFGGWSEQRADILLRSVGGRWFWSSLLLYRPPPLGASADTIVGYARLMNVTDATVTVRFRTVGSRCCSDQSWNDRVVLLRRDGGTTYNKAGGVSASSLADSGIAPGSDVWVQFRLDTLGVDGSYRLAWIVAMYP